MPRGVPAVQGDGRIMHGTLHEATSETDTRQGYRGLALCWSPRPSRAAGQKSIKAAVGVDEPLSPADVSRKAKHYYLPRSF
ncbi:hypothetical protein E2C01_031999 [Portunus trituberculatus]|uniref:Uncharacterized protein n=1 Tax=Portunus trituberculatus TaxID=210409 RepID=A0A5B7EWA2_PORTR|nr:hypothetical protein [Portunus trituberculatus]